MSSQTTPPVFSPVETDSTPRSREVEFVNRGCCFWIPCLGARSDETVWERISSSDKEESGVLSKGIESLKKVREWSELVAGPKWKTFIRRFNKNRCKAGMFQYDPLSYAMNFDEGHCQNTQVEDERFTRGFSARYATMAGSTKAMDCGKALQTPPLI